MKKVFVLDDEFDILLSLSRWFMNKGCYVRTFSESKSLFDALSETTPDVIAMDTNLQKEDSREIRRQIKTRYSADIPIVLFSSSPDGLQELKDNCADHIIRQSSISSQEVSASFVD